MPKQHRQLSELTDDAVICRALHHDWEEIPAWNPRKGTLAFGHVTFSERCVRCGKEKNQAWHRKTGQLIHAPRYTHPQGYHTISREVKRADLRVEMMNRLNW